MTAFLLAILLSSCPPPTTSRDAGVDTAPVEEPSVDALSVDVRHVSAGAREQWFVDLDVETTGDVASVTVTLTPPYGEIEEHDLPWVGLGAWSITLYACAPFADAAATALCDEDDVALTTWLVRAWDADGAEVARLDGSGEGSR